MTNKDTSKKQSAKRRASAFSHFAYFYRPKNISHTYASLSGSRRVRWSTALRGVLVGILVGFLVVLYRLGIEYGTDFATWMYGELKTHLLWLPLWCTAAVVAGYLIYRLIRWEPMASGSGIPQSEGVLLLGLKMRWWSVLITRFMGGLVAGLFGLSLGREGPSIQIGSAGAQAVGKLVSRSELEQKTLITGGAAAGLSAAFNAPLSGMMFALEEVHRSFSPAILLTATTAALSADFVSKYCFGLKPVLNFTTVPQMPLETYWWLIPLGLLTGLIGSAMNKSLLGLQTLYGKIPAPIRPTVAIAISLPVGLLIPMALGGGVNVIKFAEQADSEVLFIAVLLLVRIIFTSTSFGAGTPGGIFMPILSVGALTGSLFGNIAYACGWIQSPMIADFAAIAMAGVLAASVKAPITSILLVVEMSGSFVHMLPVAAVVFIAMLVSDALHIDPIYHSLLNRYLKSTGDAEHAEQSNPKISSGIMELPVEMGSVVDGKQMRDIDWPKGVAVISVHRAGRDFVPGLKTQFQSGDDVTVVFSDVLESVVRERMSDLCEAKVI